jgi:hypothetical protein
MAEADGDDESDEERVSDDEVREALSELRGDDPELGHVLRLVRASLERDATLVPRSVIAATMAKWDTDRDLANGGADQVAWNHGSDATRAYAAAFRAVGALENADLFDRLAGELEAYRAEVGDAAVSADPVKSFLAYRRRVGGPEFGVPEPAEELAEALLEHVLEHLDELPAADAPLP